MLNLLADHDVEGQVAQLLLVLESATWKELWASLDVAVHTFDSLGIAVDASDVEIWRLCQARDIILITNNRNSRGEDSLGATIQREVRMDSLPVMTFANLHRFANDKSYARHAAERLLDYLLRIDELRGTGRLYVP